MRKTHRYRRRTPLKRVIRSLLLLIVVGIAGAGGVALWGMNEVRAPGPLSAPTNVVIAHGQPTTEIGALLERQGVVSDHRLFILTTYLTRAARGDLKAGEYEFPAGASIADVLAILRSGRAVVHKITVPEGWTTAQVVERVNAHPALAGALTEVPMEGSLLPDTYVFERGVARDALIARMRQSQATLLDELWAKRAPDLPIESPEEAVILASIVEKETGVAAERQQVAAVFVNRLRRNMRLQSDPTIIYGITGGERYLDRPISRNDIAAETPYNTYRIDGLPPTPIANPGREAIAAVLQPVISDHLYFVADGSGGHAFAKTLAEHNANVRRWRKIEQQAEDEAPIEAAAEEPEAQEEPEELEEHEPALAGDENDPAPPEASTLVQDEAGLDELAAVTVTGQQPLEPEPPSAAAPVVPPAPAASLTERSVPLPMPKPARN